MASEIEEPMEQRVEENPSMPPLSGSPGHMQPSTPPLSGSTSHVQPSMPPLSGSPSHTQPTMPPLSGSPGHMQPSRPPLSGSPSHVQHSRSTFMVSPRTNRVWQTLMVVLAAYGAWAYPFEVAFLRKSSHSYKVFFIANSIVNIFFAVDILMTLFIDPTTHLLVRDLKKIAHSCMSIRFIMDLASSLPFELILYLFIQHYRMGPVYTILGFLRFWRLRHVIEYFTGLEKDIRFSYFWVRCTRLLCVTVFFLHCFGCIYYLIAVVHPREGMTWIGSLNLDYEDTDLHVLYISAMYWSITTMSTVGYGDLHGVNTSEMFFIIFFMIFNLGLSTYVLGNMTSLVAEGSRRTLQFRMNVETTSNFVSESQVPSRLKNQILSYITLRFKAESLNQHHLIEQLPRTLRKRVRQHLFLPKLDEVYMFKGVAREILLLLVGDMKDEYVPPREDIIIQNETPDVVYVILSGDVEVIKSDPMEKERVLRVLHSFDMFGEVDAFSSKPHSNTYRTVTLSHLLRIKTTALVKAMHTKQHGKVSIHENFIQHHKMKNDTNLRDWSEEEHIDEMTKKMLILSDIGDATLLEELLQTKVNPNVSDSKGRTPLHIAASKGHEECVSLLLKHGCNVHLRDIDGNTAVWDAIASNNHLIFHILFLWASVSDKSTAGDLLCTAAKRNDITVMKELLKAGLDMDSKDRHGSTVVEIAVSEKNVEIVRLLATKCYKE